MAWVATLLKKDTVNDGSVKLVVEYAFGPKKAQKEYVFFSNFDVEIVVRDEINRLEALRLGYIALTENTQVQPSSVATAITQQSQFQASLGRLSSFQNLIDLGVVASNNSDFVALKSSVIAGFQSSYI